MKCMDCISVCPKGALYYGFGAPSVVKGRPRGGLPHKTYDFTWKEETAYGAAGRTEEARKLYAEFH